MAQFDLHRSRDGIGYLLGIQHSIHDRLSTRVVIPLIPEEAAPKHSRVLNPILEIEEACCILFPQYLSTGTRRELGESVGTLRARRDAIVAASDVLLDGV